MVGCFYTMSMTCRFESLIWDLRLDTLMPTPLGCRISDISVETGRKVGKIPRQFMYVWGAGLPIGKSHLCTYG